MTTQDQTLQRVDAANVNAWVNEHWKGDHACPICGNTHWGINEDIVEVGNYRLAQRFNLDGETICPPLLIYCETCSYTMLFSAVMLGLVEEVDQGLEDQPNGSEIRVTSTILIGRPGQRRAIPILLDDWDTLARRIESRKLSLQSWSIGTPGPSPPG